MMPIHPEAGPDPRTVRWRTPAGVLPGTGTVLAAPVAVQRLLDDGTLAAVRIAVDHVEVTLAAGRHWPAEGARVRAALLAGLDQPSGWQVAGDAAGAPRVDDSDRDERLHAAAVEVLAGEIGELARSHGGSLELESVADGVVEVRMDGACHGCPAAEITLHARLEKSLREACPDLRELRPVESPGGVRRAARWLRRGRPTN